MRKALFLAPEAVITPPVPPERHTAALLRRLAAGPTDPAYDMRDPNHDGGPGNSLLTPVRNQASCGACCWTFATYGALESHLEQSLAEAADFSEDNLKHLHGFDPTPCAGGNIDMSTAYLARYQGPISEADDPYDPAVDSEYCTDCSPVRYVDNVVFLPTRAATADNAYIKQALVDYGGVYTSILYESASYDAAEHTYCYLEPNHSLDDRLPRGRPSSAARVGNHIVWRGGEERLADCLDR